MERKHFEYLKFLMILAGIWRLELVSKSKTLKYVYGLYTVFIQMTFACFVIRLFVRLATVWKEDINVTMENLETSIFCITLTLKIIICQSKGIIDLIRKTLADDEKLRNSENQEDKMVYYDYANHTFKVSLAITFYTYVILGIPMVIFAYINYMRWEKKYGGTNTTVPKPLPVVTWYPFDENKYYISAFCLEVWCMIAATTCNNVTQTFFVTMMNFMIGRLIVLQQHFRNFDSYRFDGATITDEKAVLGALKELIKDHLGIIGLVENFDNSMRLLMLLEFLTNSLQIASLLVQFLMNDDTLVILHVITYIGIVTSQLFLLAWNANEIKEQSSALSVALYESRWYEHGISVRKYILLMMMRSQKPLTMQIGPFYPMTADTAISTMKAAYSYVTIMR